MSPLTLVQEAVKKAVPEIMELKEGCRIIVNSFPKEQVIISDFICKYKHDDGKIHKSVKANHGDKIYLEKYLHHDTYITEILGREIRLSDILRTINKTKEPRIRVDSDGTFCDKTHGEMGYQWNLAEDSLSWHATHCPETIDFLAGLLSTPQ